MKNTKKHKSYNKHIKTYKKKNNNFKKVNCSPNPNKNGFSCYTDNVLHKMKKYWNIRHPRNRIKSKHGLKTLAKMINMALAQEYRCAA